MNITVLSPMSHPAKNVTITHHDALLIKEISEKVGPIAAMRALRWLANCSLTSAKDFVLHGLKDIKPAATEPADNIKVCETKEDENESR